MADPTLIARRLGDLRLQTYAAPDYLQRLAVDFGFRIAESAHFVQATQAVNLAVQEHLTQVIDPPSFDMMGEMIEVISNEMAK